MTFTPLPVRYSRNEWSTPSNEVGQMSGNGDRNVFRENIVHFWSRTLKDCESSRRTALSGPPRATQMFGGCQTAIPRTRTKNIFAGRRKSVPQDQLPLSGFILRESISKVASPHEGFEAMHATFLKPWPTTIRARNPPNSAMAQRQERNISCLS